MAFVLVAALSSTVLAVTTFALAHEYRWRKFRERSHEQALLTLDFAPSALTEQTFRQLESIYASRAEAEIMGEKDGLFFSSTSALTSADIPPALRGLDASAGLTSGEATAAGRSWYVTAGSTRDGSRYYLFFSLQQLRSSLHEFEVALAAAWLMTVALALAIGAFISRRVLRPVRFASQAAQDFADGQLDTRLPVSRAGEDEFGTLARSFNTMAESLQRTIEELRAAAARERRFTSDVAHDLRTPLTSMAASAQLLGQCKDSLPHEARVPAELLAADVERFRNLVTELLELAQLDAHANPVEPEALSVKDAVAATTDSIGSACPLTVRLEAVDGLVVWAERSRLRRILGNVLVNASVHGGGTVLVTGRRDGDDVVLEICDNGPGIPAADLPHVFDRFYKSDASRARQGSGLGLAIALQQARAMGGSLTAHNRPEGGACFTLRLPHPLPGQRESDSAGAPPDKVPFAAR